VRGTLDYRHPEKGHGRILIKVRYLSGDVLDPFRWNAGVIDHQSRSIVGRLDRPARRSRTRDAPNDTAPGP
jgi:hypothetical protein